jgi:hypothetical protein
MLGGVQLLLSWMAADFGDVAPALRSRIRNPDVNLALAPNTAMKVSSAES